MLMQLWVIFTGVSFCLKGRGSVLFFFFYLKDLFILKEKNNRLLLGWDKKHDCKNYRRVGVGRIYHMNHILHNKKVHKTNASLFLMSTNN